MNINKPFYPDDEICKNPYILNTATIMAKAAKSPDELKAAVQQELNIANHEVYTGGLSTVGDFDERINTQAKLAGLDLGGHSGSSWAIAIWTAWQLFVNGSIPIGSDNL